MVVGAPEGPLITQAMKLYLRTHRPVMTMALMVKRSPFTSTEVARMTDFSQRMGFVDWQLHGGEPDPAVRALVSDRATRGRFVDDFPLVVGPTTDDRPFFFTFYRWADLR